MLHRNLKLRMKVCRNSFPYKPFLVVHLDQYFVRLEDENTGNSKAFTVREFDSGNWIEWE